MKRTKVKDLLAGEPSEEVLLKGWLKTRRDSKGGFSFLEINDGSCLANIQVVVEHALADYVSIENQLTTGSCVSVRGQLVASEGKGQSMEIQATAIQIYGPAPVDYPLQKKRHSFEFLREIAHLRPRTNTFGAVMRVRNRLAFSIHRFFQEKSFIYLNTPIVTTSDCEGAGEMFQVTTLDLSNPPRVGGDGAGSGKIDFSQDFFAGNCDLG